MRQARWLSLCAVFLAGCVGPDANSSDVDLPPSPLPKPGPPAFSTATGDTMETDSARPKAKADTPAKTPEQIALGKCLPLGLHLSLSVYPPDGPSFVLEKRLAEIGARCRADGALVDARGTEIYRRPPNVPSGEHPLQVPDLPKVPQAECRQFLEALLTPDQLARWRANGREFRLMWSFEKDTFDRVMLTREDFGALPQPPPNLIRP
jgi:hypothetical protein